MERVFDNEDILPDDYPIYGDYAYVTDGKVYRSDWHRITVKELKKRMGFKEVRRCNIVDRILAVRSNNDNDRTNQDL